MLLYILRSLAKAICYKPAINCQTEDRERIDTIESTPNRTLESYWNVTKQSRTPALLFSGWMNNKGEGELRTMSHVTIDTEV